MFFIISMNKYNDVRKNKPLALYQNCKVLYLIFAYAKRTSLQPLYKCQCRAYPTWKRL